MQHSINISNKQNKWTKMDKTHSGIRCISPLMNAGLHRNCHADSEWVQLVVHMKSRSNFHCHRWQKFLDPVLKIMEPQSHCQVFFGNMEIFGKQTKHKTDVFMLQAKKKSLKRRTFSKRVTMSSYIQQKYRQTSTHKHVLTCSLLLAEKS